MKKTLFFHFCGGETLEECKTAIDALAQFNIKTIPDYAAEGGSSEEAYKDAFENILDTIEFTGQQENVAFTVFKPSAIGSVAVLDKVQSGKVLNDEETKMFDLLKERIDILCHRAAELKVPIMADAEESWIQDAVDAIITAMMSKYNKETAIVYNTFQMYRSDMPKNLENVLRLAKDEQFYLGAKLVRGAYWDKERERAAKLKYKSPVFETKPETDEAFDNALKLCVENIDRVHVCCGSHNEKSNMLLTDLMREHNIEPDDPRVSFSQLYGMGDHISFNLSQRGYNVTKYLPWGPVEAAVPYLIRRANENQSVAGQASRELSLIRKELDRRKMEYSKDNPADMTKL
ncbi:proline dehydrogenase family protein [Cytophagaceae bacterium ABcell3]|nr:proline dehydrogenase family protein [Cytophagaceae bacterium ABcell3]